MTDCIFCKIINKEIPSTFLYESEDIIAINDLNPQAETHVLVITKVHVPNLMEITEEHLMITFLQGIRETVKKLGITDFRTIINTGKNAGQTIFHMHAHILSGKGLSKTQL